MRFASFQSVFGGIANQAPLITHTIHDVVADIYTGAAGNAFILQPVTDINTYRADMDAVIAVDTIAQSFCLIVGALFTLTAILAADIIIGDYQCVLVKHYALEAGVRTHVDADLLTHPASIGIGCYSQKAYPPGFPWAQIPGENRGKQFANGCEIAHKCDG